MKKFKILICSLIALILLGAFAAIFLLPEYTPAADPPDNEAPEVTRRVLADDEYTTEISRITYDGNEVGVRVVNDAQELTNYPKYSEKGPLNDYLMRYVAEDLELLSKTLILFEITEGSGSIEHNIKQPAINSSGKLEINIERISPEVGTCDMAQHLVVIEINKSLGITKADDVIVNIN